MLLFFSSSHDINRLYTEWIRDFRQNNSRLLFTVSTPRCKKFHHPHIVAVQNQAVKVIISQLYHIFLISTTASTGTLKLANAQNGKINKMIRGEKRKGKKKKTGLCPSVPVCCSQNLQSFHSVGLSLKIALHSELPQQSPDCCVHLRPKHPIRKELQYTTLSNPKYTHRQAWPGREYKFNLI